jgi:hypothetical protein
LLCPGIHDGSGSSVHEVHAPIIESSQDASVSKDKPTITISSIQYVGKHQIHESPSSPVGVARTYAATKTNVETQEH